jgi:hypothetical protein
MRSATRLAVLRAVLAALAVPVELILGQFTEKATRLASDPFAIASSPSCK